MKKIITFLLIVLFSIVTLFLCAEFNLIDLTGAYNNSVLFNRVVSNGLSIDDDNLSKSYGTENRYYYEQLSASAKKIYDSIINNKDNMKSGTYVINIDSSELDDILKDNNLLNFEFQNAINALSYDNVDLFYIDFSKMVLNTKSYISDKSTRYELSLTPSSDNGNYYTDYIKSNDDLNEFLSKVETLKNDILKDAKGNNYKKIKYIHDYLIDELSYDESYKSVGTRDIYGALVNKIVVCEGYSKAFKYLLDELNIPCILVSGTAVDTSGNEEAHMWNYVKINDTWYLVDVTWDDPVIEGGSNLNMYRYKYFCQGDNINTDHFLENKITENSQEFIYPEIYHKESK